MATSNETRPPRLQRRIRLRALLLIPPLALLVTSLLLFVTAPLSWGAAEVIDAGDWMPPALGIVVALGGLWIGLYTLRRVLRTTRGDFEVFALQTVFGMLIFLSGAVMMISLLTRLPKEATYEGFLDDNGQPGFDAAWYFGFSILFGIFQIGWVWVGAYLYSHAISNQRPNRISARHPDEVDGVGALLRERDA